MRASRNLFYRPSTYLHIVALFFIAIAVSQYMRFYVLDEWTHPGAHTRIRNIAVLMTPDRPLNSRAASFAKLPASHFYCINNGQCSGQIDGRPLTIDIAFITFPTYTCSGTYDGAPIACTGSDNNDDRTMPYVDIQIDELGLTEEEAESLARTALFAPYHGMERVWPVLAVLYGCWFIWLLVSQVINRRPKQLQFR